MEIIDPVNTKRKNALYFWLIILSGIAFFFPYLGHVHLFDWDEINFAESAREMIVTGNYHQVQINFEPFWEKPPLFFWLQAGAMHLFGINEYAARFPNAVFGVITLASFYLIGRKHKSVQFGWIWALAYLGTFLPHLYFKSAIIDPVFNYFIFMSIYFMYLDISGHKVWSKYTYPALAGICIGLATLTKGPVGPLVFGLVYLVYFILNRFKKFPSFSKILTFVIAFVLTSLLWFGPELIEHGFWFLNRFISYQIELFFQPVAGHGEPFYYHFVVVFIGCFPISVLALPVFFKKNKDKEKRDFSLIMKILFWTIMILFSLTTTKIVHYSSLTYMPLAFLAARYLDNLITNRQAMKKYVRVLIIVMGFVFSFLLAALPYVAQHPDLILPYLKDPFAQASLEINVAWGGYESWIGIGYFILVCFSVILFSKKQIRRGMLFLFYGTALCLFGYLLAVVPKIEKYTQGPAIEFYQSLQGKDVYVWPVGFKSYAQYFYARKPERPVYGNDDLDFLLRGDITRPAYFVIKITNKDFVNECKDCHLIEQKGGFKFYKRDATN